MKNNASRSTPRFLFFYLPLALILSSGFLLKTRADEANAIKPLSMELYPTHLAVSVELPYEGDANGNGTASFVWRKNGDATWHNGVDMTIDRKRRFIWASVWPLEAGETVEVEVMIEDADKPAAIKLSGKTATRAIASPTPIHRTFYVSTSGNDANAGTKDAPFKTLARAAKETQPGDAVLVAAGIYKEGDLLTGLKGTAEKPIAFTAAKGVVLDSSLEIAKGSGSWKLVEGTVYETGVSFKGITQQGYVAQDGLRSFKYRTLDELKQDAFKVGRAWYFDRAAGKLYVRTGDTATPNDHTYNVAQHDYAFALDRSEFVIVQGFEMRYYAAACIGMSKGARGNSILNNILHNAQLGIGMDGDNTRDNVIWHNEIYEPGLPDFDWNAIKKSSYGRQGIFSNSGRGNSYCYNKVHGWFDGFAIESWKNPDRLILNRDCDIFFNEFYNIGDDAIELDGGGVNMRFHGNRIRNAHSAISLAPIERGPVYITRNDATYRTLMFKMSVGDSTSHGWTYCYHNSGYTLDAGNGASMIRFATQKMLPCTNKIFKNNAIIGSEWSVRDWVKGVNFVLDYNCYYQTPKTGFRAFHGDGVRFESLDEFREATKQELNGIYANPRFTATPGLGEVDVAKPPLLKDSSEGDMRPKPKSPLIDSGAVLRGINDNFKGKAPDIGAFESE